jgi:hypothetical protein
MENSFEWNAPVVLNPCPGLVNRRIIANTRDAGHFLMFEWPWDRGLTHDKALRMCGLVLGGFIDAEVARTWVVNAAKEVSLELIAA